MKTNMMKLKIRGELKTIQRYVEVEFTSDRKMMSVIVELDNKIIIFTKGADNVIKERLSDKNDKEIIDDC